jgi:DNA/RNA-binding domain of Phe-tRNA-synthetase-like protein
MNRSVAVAISETVHARVPTLFVATRTIRDVSVATGTPALDRRKAALISRWAGQPRTPIETQTLIRAYRDLARELGGQLTPAVEGLYVRGILRGRFPAINPLVDTANIVSAEHLVPIGVFDDDRIDGPAQHTHSTPGESFVPIGKDEVVVLDAGTPVLRDAVGIFSAIGARDSSRTMITPTTSAILAVSWGFQDVEPAVVDATLDEFVELLRVRS